MNGNNPLDASAVHPEAYPIVERILAGTNKPLSELMGNSLELRQLKPADYIDEHFGLPTIMDIIKELDKPGRDPRPEFKTAQFAENIETMADLKVGMIMEGVVSNVTNFGAFVDIGVHQDGLVHISSLSNHFVEDPRTVVKTGDIVKVKVLDIDLDRKRIALTMRMDEPTVSANTDKPRHQSNQQRQPTTNKGKQTPITNHAMGNAFAQALGKFKS
ncbi:MAG: S1 RNA-binding domain-containing protein, partial [Candidatus Schmidhempelia sp.]|nr:S1 RNA-binding domain-containing protein [Candidatus Schmidhempelia sp.]